MKEDTMNTEKLFVRYSANTIKSPSSFLSHPFLFHSLWRFCTSNDVTATSTADVFKRWKVKNNKYKQTFYLYINIYVYTCIHAI